MKTGRNLKDKYLIKHLTDLYLFLIELLLLVIINIIIIIIIIIIIYAASER